MKVQGQPKLPDDLNTQCLWLLDDSACGTKFSYLKFLQNDYMYKTFNWQKLCDGVQPGSGDINFYLFMSFMKISQSGIVEKW